MIFNTDFKKKLLFGGAEEGVVVMGADVVNGEYYNWNHPKRPAWKVNRFTEKRTRTLWIICVHLTILVRIKCRDLVKKIAIYRNRLAVSLIGCNFNTTVISTTVVWRFWSHYKWQLFCKDLYIKTYRTYASLFCCHFIIITSVQFVTMTFKSLPW